MKRRVVCECGAAFEAPSDAPGDMHPCPRCGRVMILGPDGGARGADTGAWAGSEVGLFIEEGTEPEALWHRGDDTPAADVEGLCARCGKAFRGEWDQVETGRGVYCHICANLATEPGATPAERARPLPETRPAGPDPFAQLSWMVPEKPDEKARLAQSERRRKKREVALILLAGLVTITIVMVWPAGDGPPRDAAARAEEIPAAWAFLGHAVHLVLSIGGWSAGLYIALRQFNKLPNETFKANVLACAIVGTVLYLASFWPCLGFALALLIVVMLYDLSCGEVLVVAIVMPLVLWATWALRMLLIGMLGVLLT